MYFDLFLPFPLAPTAEQPKKKKDKGKNKAQPVASLGTGQHGREEVNPWEGLDDREKDGFARDVALTGHLGYSVVGCTVLAEPSTLPVPSPFRSHLPFAQLDPRRSKNASGSSSSSTARPEAPVGDNLSHPVMVQVTRYHMRLDDSKTHCLTSSNSNVLKDYDILSVQPTSDKAFQLACTDLSAPGPNQLSIITLPLHERPYHFRLNRKQMKQAQRNGIMFEILYSPGLFPGPGTSQDVARRYRQNFMSNAREIIRITGGKGIILSSGPGGVEGKRGPLDVINLATMLGMPANLAKDAISLNPKRVLLNAQARRTFKAIFSAPKMVPPPSSLPPSGLTSGKPNGHTPSEAIDGDVEMKQPDHGKRQVETQDPPKVKKKAKIQS